MRAFFFTLVKSLIRAAKVATIKFNKRRTMAGFWNYRVIFCEATKDEAAQYQIHEVEYNLNGKVTNWSETGAAPFGNTLDALRDDAERLKTAFEKPVLKVVRKERGYELVDVETGEEAFAEPPAGLTA